MTPWPPELRDEIGNALIVAGNALTGYAQLSNGPETHEHHQAALHALEAVQAAIRKCGVLEEQGIVAARPATGESGIKIGDTVKMTDQAYRKHQPTSAFRNGQVVDLYGGFAEVEWIDQFIPREVRIEDLEKVERKKPAPEWTGKAGGFAIGDEVRFKPEFLRSTGQVAGESAQLQGRIVELEPLGQVVKATVEWSNGRTHGVVTNNLVKVKSREAGR